MAEREVVVVYAPMILRSLAEIKIYLEVCIYDY